jgi:hypothetical protein
LKAAIVRITTEILIELLGLSSHEKIHSINKVNAESIEIIIEANYLPEWKEKPHEAYIEATKIQSKIVPVKGCDDY